MLKNIKEFLSYTGSDGTTNLDKIEEKQHIIRRVETTDKNKSYEDAGDIVSTGEYPPGIVREAGKLIGFGIHIFNEDVYPLKSFEIYFRNCGLEGSLDLSGETDLIFIDMYHNRISAIELEGLSNLRILGLQDNCIGCLDTHDLISCQGIDAGKNNLKCVDVSCNTELVELYINDNDVDSIDLSHNPNLKYFYCQNNRISCLDTTSNPLLRHLNATGNPLKEIRSYAPQREERLPLELHAGEGGNVGLRFNPVYNAQWKETGEWQQTYYAYPECGYNFDCWMENGEIVSREREYSDDYGNSRVLTAVFSSVVM